MVRGFPFRPHYCPLPAGRMHYLDEGSGHPVLLLHGNPTWSYLYRRFVRPLASTHRVIAPDHLGFGRSDKPAGADYCLGWHVDNLTAFVERLDLRDLTLVVHDWGGPIGLGFAVEQPERIRRLVLFNTWAFRLPAGTRLHPLLEAIRQPGLGEKLVLEQNALVERGLPGGMCRPASPRLLAAYRAPFPDADSRRAMLAMVRDIPLGSQGETAARMGRIERGLGRLSAQVLVVWGGRDPVFPPSLVDLWRLHFPHARVELLPRASHFVQEDEPRRVVALVRRFLQG